MILKKVINTTIIFKATSCFTSYHSTINIDDMTNTTRSKLVNNFARNEDAELVFNQPRCRTQGEPAAINVTSSPSFEFNSRLSSADGRFASNASIIFDRAASILWDISFTFEFVCCRAAARKKANIIIQNKKERAWNSMTSCSESMT